MSRPSDLPEFAAVLDAHAVALARRLGEEDDVAEASGVASLDGEPLARHWLEGLAMLWKGNLAKAPPDIAPHLAPLGEVVRRVSALTGVPLPDLDEEGGHDVARLEGGVDDDG